MSKALKRGTKLVESLKGKVDLVKLEEMKDFYLRRRDTQMAIRKVQAYHILGTDAVLVLGELDLAAKTAHESYSYQLNQQNNQEIANTKEETEELLETNEDLKETEVEFTEQDVQIIMDQGGVTREEAIKALQENEGDPLAALTALDK
ncbi:hypothetical protein NEHOM01_1764 [Nematocida homosporus]|uniref:uncharacterized protein n=1 Tax=Nematocida homosporus TaxID=1912981 RepID=UPI00221F476D|nr:uncharacterized protein NEHOM01_1764 [Nematocida homosporus]KAI5186875.1 hypothetical protein NEHOM01_1764 [Nematocida homosporus]